MQTLVKKIRLVCFSFGILEQGGGFENFLITLTHGLAEKYPDLDITIVTMSPKIVERLQHILSIYFLKSQGSKSIYRESNDSVLRRLGSVKYVQAASIRELRSILQAGDMLYTKNELLELATLRLVGTKKLPPMMTGIHTPLVYPAAATISAKLHNLLYKSPLYAWLLKPVTSVHVSNDNDYKYVLQAFKPQHLTLLPQPVGLNSGSAYRAHTGRLRLLFVGRLTAIKGVALLQEIIAELEKRYAGKYHLKVVGSGEPSVMDEFRAVSKKNDAVEYIGHVENNRIHEFYDWTDITLITSVYETLSKAAIETSMSKRIVVSTDIAGPREVIVDGETGYLVAAEAAAFCQKIMALDDMRKQRPQAFAAMGQAGHDYVSKKFSDDAVLSAFDEELRRLVIS
jgi:glycosyltransferase involved in cell wall biosynthesis